MRISFFLAVVMSVLVGSDQARAAWVARDQGAGIEAFTQSRAGASALVLSCRVGSPAIFTVVMPTAPGWNPKGKVQLDVDGAQFPVTIEGGSDQVTLSDAGSGVLGIADATLRAIRSGKVLTLTGTAAQAMPVANRSFDLSGAGKAIGKLAAKCGLDRMPAPAPAPVTAQNAQTGASLPLISGEYTSGRCTNPPDVLHSIGIYKLTDGPNAGRQFISPVADGVDGFCVLKGGIKVAGNVYSAAPSCDSGGRASIDIGRYSLSYRIINDKTFISNGKTYSWCVAHR